MGETLAELHPELGRQALRAFAEKVDQEIMAMGNDAIERAALAMVEADRQGFSAVEQARAAIRAYLEGAPRLTIDNKCSKLLIGHVASEVPIAELKLDDGTYVVVRELPGSEED